MQAWCPARSMDETRHRHSMCTATGILLVPALPHSCLATGIFHCLDLLLFCLMRCHIAATFHSNLLPEDGRVQPFNWGTLVSRPKTNDRRAAGCMSSGRSLSRQVVGIHMGDTARVTICQGEVSPEILTPETPECGNALDEDFMGSDDDIQMLSWKGTLHA